MQKTTWFEPTLPYSGTEGHAQHDTSASRLGVDGSRQGQILDFVWASKGATAKEIEDALDLGHGTVSGALSALHRSNHLVMLATKRGGQHVYCPPSMAGEAKTVEPKSNVAHSVVCEAHAAFQAGHAGRAFRILSKYLEATQ